MSHVGDVARARADFLERRPSNLSFLLAKRYGWMNEFIGESDKGVEVGAGHGLSKEFIKAKNFVLTDTEKNPWIDVEVDALVMPFEDESLDYVVSSNMIHHLAQPLVFFEECARVLKKGGRVIIQEINCSLAMRMILRLMSHEGYSYDANVFDKEMICNNPADPWSANCAIPNLLFDNLKEFENRIPDFKATHHRYTEFFIFIISGGVTAKVKTINLPRKILRYIDKFDDILISVSKNTFPLQRNIVLEKK